MSVHIPPPDADHRVADLTWQMSGVIERADVIAGMMMLLDSVFASDRVSWSRLNTQPDTIAYVGPGRDVAPASEIAQHLVDTYRDHPMIMSYFPGIDRSHGRPRRTTDLVSRSDLKKTRAYSELLHPNGSEWQMTILTDLDVSKGVTGIKGSCWVFDRDRRDYTDNDIELATRLRTVLTVFERTLSYRTAENLTSEPAASYDLTSREIEVLSLVAYGFTAHAVADYLRISELTVRKHLENTYRKLDCGDRLIAVDRARKAGLIPA